MEDSTDQKAGSAGRAGVHPIVFGFSAGLTVLFLLLTLANLGAADTMFAAVKDGIARRFGWFLILSVQGFLLLCVYLAASRYGQIRIGGADARPEFSRLSWFAMLFAAGMGIGIMFWSVAEPILHLQDPHGAAAMTPAGAQRALDLTYLHWGLHVWGIYALVGLALAYFAYNRGLPMTIRSAFHPLLGERIHGPIGHAIDVLAVLAALFGLATSLGLGVVQVNAGLNYAFGIDVSIGTQLALVAVITLASAASVASGLERGIKILSNVNLVAALLLMLFVLLAGPTWFLLENLVESTGHYLQNLLALGSWTETYDLESDWQASWTVFYWSWWIAWSPFVGMFIARISRGRTVREFIVGVLAMPSLLTVAWMATFGGAAIYESLFVDTGIVQAANANSANALFELLSRYPLQDLSVLLAIFLVGIFFVTSCDSGSLVMGIITCGGETDIGVLQRTFWALLAGVVAAVLLTGGGLTALQTASISTGLPFALALVFMAICLLKAFREDPAVKISP